MRSYVRLRESREDEVWYSIRPAEREYYKVLLYLQPILHITYKEKFHKE